MNENLHWKLKIGVPVLYCLGSIVLFFIIASYSDIPFTHLNIFGISICVSGFILWIIARIQLKHFYTVKPQAKGLVTSGLYKKIRHPVYVFSSLAILGMAIFLNARVVYAMLLLTVILQIVRIRKEEKILTVVFKERYLKYKKETWF